MLDSSLGFSFCGLFIPYYGLMITIGVTVAAILGLIQIKIFRLNLYDFIILAAMIGLGAIIGAKLLFIIVSWKEIDFSRIFEIEYLKMLMSGGFVFYGGLIGGLIAVVITHFAFKINVLPYVRTCMHLIPIAHGFGRIGCSIVGCCYGMPYDGPFAITYTDSVIAPNNISLFPVQLTEAVCEFVIGIILLIYINTNREKIKNPLALYLIMYSILRFILEYLRYDAARGFAWLFSTSQWISIGLFVATMLYFVRNNNNNKSTDKNTKKLQE